ncbi:MAG: formylglycine-generating enzyme family protein [Acidobacteriota bacterium]
MRTATLLAVLSIFLRLSSTIAIQAPAGSSPSAVDKSKPAPAVPANFGSINNTPLKSGDIYGIIIEAGAKKNEKTLIPEMIALPGTIFQMGDDNGDQDEKPMHAVTLSSFAIGRFEITNAQFTFFADFTGYRTEAEKEGFCYTYTATIEVTKSFIEKRLGLTWRSFNLPGRENHPVVCVSWNDAVAYCNWLSSITGRKYRLPTEAEWEYAAGGGQGAKYTWGNSWENEACNSASYWAKTQTAGKVWIDWWNTQGAQKTEQANYCLALKVGSFKANSFGLYDLIGNVGEWCSDWYSETNYKTDFARNPSGPLGGARKVVRGCSWIHPSNDCRISSRAHFGVASRAPFYGFRIAATTE